MYSLVALQTCLLHKEPLCSVHSLMALQTCLLSKRVITECALEGLFPGVHSTVILQLLTPMETFATEFTGKQRSD